MASKSGLLPGCWRHRAVSAWPQPAGLLPFVTLPAAVGLAPVGLMPHLLRTDRDGPFGTGFLARSWAMGLQIRSNLASLNHFRGAVHKSDRLPVSLQSQCQLTECNPGARLDFTRQTQQASGGQHRHQPNFRFGGHHRPTCAQNGQQAPGACAANKPGCSARFTWPLTWAGCHRP